MSAVTIEFTESVDTAVDLTKPDLHVVRVNTPGEGTTVTIEYPDGELLDAEIVGVFGDGSLALIDEADDSELVVTIDVTTRIITVH